MSLFRPRVAQAANAEPPAGPRGAALFRRAQLARQQPAIKRMIAGIILLASVAGAVLWGGGGVSSWQALTPLWWGAAAALVVQIGCTSIQWTFCADWWNPFYLGALFFSTATTMLGYWPLVHVPLTAAIATQAGAASFAGYYASFVAGLLILAFALILDILPEKVLTQ